MDKGKVLDVLRKRVIDRIDVTKDSSDDDVWQIIDEELFRFSRDRNKGSPIGIQEKLIYGKEIFDSIRGLDVLESLLKDDEITEIMINGPNNATGDNTTFTRLPSFNLVSTIGDVSFTLLFTPATICCITSRKRSSEVNLPLN